MMYVVHPITLLGERQRVLAYVLSWIETFVKVIGECPLD